MAAVGRLQLLAQNGERINAVQSLRDCIKQAYALARERLHWAREDARFPDRQLDDLISAMRYRDMARRWRNGG